VAQRHVDDARRLGLVLRDAEVDPPRGDRLDDPLADTVR